MYNYVSATAKGQLIGKGEMHKSKDSYYSKFMNDEMISNQNCTVILNHDSKEMYCFIGEKQKRRDRQAIVPPDSLSRPGDSSVLVGIENGCNHIIIYHKNSYYLRTELFISIATNLPSRIVYFYAPDTEDFAVDAYKTELVYEKISFDEPDKDIFSEEKYVEKKNGKWFTTTAFRNYKLTVSETPEQ